MGKRFSLDTSLKERRRIIRLLDFLKRDDLTSEQMERIGRRLQKSGHRALHPLVRKLWREKNGAAIYRYTCMLDFFDDLNWLDQLIQITIKRTDLDEQGRLVLLDALQDNGVDVTAPPFAAMTGYGAATMEGFVDECLGDGERGLARFMDMFLNAEGGVRDRMMQCLAQAGTPEAVSLLEILLSFERPEVVREAIIALGKIKSGFALTVLKSAEKQSEGQVADLIRRSIRRLSFVGIRKPEEPPDFYLTPRPLYQTQAGPLDIYGSRPFLFSWRLDDEAYALLLLLIGESEGIINAISYRMKDAAEYDAVFRDITIGEFLEPVESSYALALLRDAIFNSHKQGSHLPPDLYVGMRLFDPALLRPEAYVPRFSLECLENIVDRIPEYISDSNELLDNASFEGWLFSDSAVYDAAERLNKMDKTENIRNDILEEIIDSLCGKLVEPRKPEIVKYLLLTADFMQQTGIEREIVQRTLATALSLVGGVMPEKSHPFIRRLILDSLDLARQALAEGYDPRLEEGYDNE